MLDDGQTMNGWMPEHAYTISLPCEPGGSGELKRALAFCVVFLIFSSMCLKVT